MDKNGFIMGHYMYNNETDAEDNRPIEPGTRPGLIDARAQTVEGVRARARARARARVRVRGCCPVKRS